MVKNSVPWTLNNPKTISKQISLLTLANLKTRYRKTFAGFLWVMFNPIISFGVFSLIFYHVLRIDIDKYYMYLLTGIIPWIFYNQTIEMTVALFVNNSTLLKAFPVHPLVYLAAQVIDNFVNFLGAFIFLLIPIGLNSGVHPLGLLLFPIPLFFFILSVSSLSYLLATLNVFYRDVRYLTTFLNSLLFFLTPIFYNIEFIPRKYQWLMNLNPLYHLFRPIRACLHKFDLNEFMVSCIWSLTVTLSITLVSLWYWKRKGSEVFHYV